MKARLFVAVAASAFFVMAVIPSVQGQAPTNVEVGIKNPTTSTPTTLFFHMIDFQDFPINTQKPDDKYTQDVQVGLATNTDTCIPNPPGSTPFQEFHVYHGYSSPSYVEYNFEQDGKPRTHPERGISYDAVMDQNAPFFLYWYLATTPGAPGSGTTDPDQVPVPVPNVVVEATIRAGDAISVDDKAYDTGPELVHGITTPATLFRDQVEPSTGNPSTTNPDVTPMGQVGNKYIFQFKVPMKVESPIIPRATGYNLRVDVHMDNPACGSDPSKELMPNTVKMHSSAQFRPRMELSIMDPIRLEYLHPQFVGDDLVVHTSMNSVWGNYDVGEVSPYTPDVTADYIQVGITGPSPATSLAQAAIVQRTHEHYHHQEAVDVTYVWPYKTDRAQNGLYTVDVKFKNDQGTAQAEGIAQFEIGKGTVIGCGGVQEAAQQLNDQCAAQVQKDGQTAKKKSPGVELVGVLAVLGAALVVARRSQSRQK